MTAPSITTCAELLLTEQHRRDPAAYLPPGAAGPLAPPPTGSPVPIGNPADDTTAQNTAVDLVSVCAALAAGLPGLAHRLLDARPDFRTDPPAPDRTGASPSPLGAPDSTHRHRSGPQSLAPLRHALRTGARALTNNWFPGDTGGFSDDIRVEDDLLDNSSCNDLDICNDLLDVPDTAPEDYLHLSDEPAEADLRTVRILAGLLLPRILIARSIVADVQGTATEEESTTLIYLIGDSSTTRLDSAGLVAAVSLTADTIHRLDALGWSPACAYARVLYADLLHRIGNDERAWAMLERTRRAMPRDAALQAHCALVEGDWSAQPDSHPTALGLLPTGTGPGGHRPQDPTRALERWQTAERLYRRIGSHSGLAAALLRLPTLPDVNVLPDHVAVPDLSTDPAFSTDPNHAAVPDLSTDPAFSTDPNHVAVPDLSTDPAFSTDPNHAAVRGRTPTAPSPADHLRLAVREARQAPNTALHASALVHQIVNDALTTDPVTPHPNPHTTRALTAWALGDGSPSYGRGLCRLLNALATRRRQEGDLLHGRHLLQATTALADRLDVPIDTQPVDSDVVDLLGTDTYLLLLASLHLLDIERTPHEATAAHDPPDPHDPPEGTGPARTWIRRAHDLMLATRGAMAVESPELLIRACDLLSSHLQSPPAPDRGTDAFAPLLGPVSRLARHSAQTGPGLAALFRGVTALAAGNPERSVEHLALTLRDPQQNNYVRCTALVHTGRHEEAEALLKNLLDTEAAPGPSIDLLLRIGDPETAARRFPLRALPFDNTPEHRPWENLSRLAQIRLAQQDPDRATTLARRALALFETQLSRLSRDLLRTTAGDDPTVARAYLTAVLGNLLLADRALAAGDRQTARTLRSEALHAADRARTGLRPLAPSDTTTPRAREELAEWLRRSTGWLAAIESAADDVTSGGSPCPDQTRAEIDRAESALARAEAPLVRHTPDRRPVLIGEPCDPDRIRRCLDPGTVLLEYHHYDIELVIFAVTRDRVTAERTTIRPYEVEAAVHDLHVSLGTPQDGPGDPSASDAVSRLAELLLDPVADLLSAADRILVVPTGALARVPWHLLSVADEPMGRNRPISCLPACGSVPRLVGDRSIRQERGALVLGDPLDAVDGEGRPLPGLPGAGAEARVVAQLYGDTALVGEAATRRAVVVRTADRPVGVLHLACHCLIDGRWPHLTGVSLASGDVLGLGDLLAAGIGCDLVVLSACTLGEYRAVDGADLTGLARALFAVGVRHLVLPLWPVDDETGCLFAVDLTHRVLAGEPVALAVHRARETLRTQDLPSRRAAYRRLLSSTGSRPAPGPVRRSPTAVPVARTLADHLSWAAFTHLGL